MTILCLEATQSFNFSPLAPADEGVERGPEERCFGVVVNAIFDLVTQEVRCYFFRDFPMWIFFTDVFVKDIRSALAQFSNSAC